MSEVKIMTKKDAVKIFNENILPAVKQLYEKDGQKDLIARKEAWNNMTDSMHRDGLISSKQYNSWSSPVKV
jgi:hypothetical protein